MNAAPGSIVIEDESRYFSLQQWMLQHIDLIQTFWWCAFWGILLLMVARFFIYAPWKQRYALADKGDDRFNIIPSGYPGSNFLFLNEIRTDIALRLFGGAVLLGFLFTFSGWQMDQSTTVSGIEYNAAVCWPFWQDCFDFIVLETLPFGYSQTVVYMVLFGFIFLGAYGLLAGRIMLAHIAILILFAAKMYFTLINYQNNANYDYYHTAFALVYLFLPYKRFFASLALVFFYFLSTATKIHEGWLLGAYFTTLRTGLPLFPDSTAPVWTNLVVFMEMIGAWFLFSRHVVLQRLSFFFFAVFHLYSGILVGYFYPSIVLPPLLILFGPLYKPFRAVPVTWKSMLGWIFFVILFFLQMISHWIPGDEKMTMEGNFYGLYMFEANHQCEVSAYQGPLQLFHANTQNARSRCDVYEYWFRLQHEYCGENARSSAPVSFTVSHSINGGPYYRIVEEADLCALEYKPFSKNAWIKNPEDAVITGNANRYNFYR